MLPGTSRRETWTRAASAPRLSVVLCTFNRCEQLRDALAALVQQRTAEPQQYEVIVVDNNSADATADIVASFARVDARVRYAREPRQGLSYARNRGILLARGPLLAFTDDDIRVPPDWVESLLHAFEHWPQASAVGGRVLPRWPEPPPAWLTPAHWGPLALSDHGSEPFRVDHDRFVCLVGANLAVRRDVFRRVGLFTPALQRVNDGVGSIEDHEFLLRLVRRGEQALYLPGIVAHADVQRERLSSGYHRRWHRGHGRFHAELARRLHQAARLPGRTFLGVPLYVYRQGAMHLAGWLTSILRGRWVPAREHEMRAWFLVGFASAVWRQARTNAPMQDAPRRIAQARPPAATIQ